MAARKLPKRLFKNPDVVHAYEHDRQSNLGMKQMTRDHADVLHNIELTLVSAAREDDQIDDRWIHEALESFLVRRDADDEPEPLVSQLKDRLLATRALRHDVPDAIWQAGLKTVRDSVARHSKLAPGDKDYIRYVSAYVK